MFVAVESLALLKSSAREKMFKEDFWSSENESCECNLIIVDIWASSEGSQSFFYYKMTLCEIWSKKLLSNLRLEMISGIMLD